MATVVELEKELATLKERNKRVEADKAWEVSWMRRVCCRGNVCEYVYIADLL